MARSSISVPLCLIALLGAMSVLGGCATCRSTAAPAPINHVVLLKLDDPDRADELVLACDERLAPIPSVATYWCGRHGDFGRSNVDADYDVALCIGFESAADYTAYVDHPDHIALVTEWKPSLTWLRIHDVVDETP